MKVLLDPQIFSWQPYGGISNQFATLFKLWSSQQLPVDLPISYSYNAYLLENKHLLPNAKLISPKEYNSSMWAGAGKLGKVFQNNSKFGVANIYKANIAATIHALNSNQYTVFQSTYFDPYFLPHLGKAKLVTYIPDMIPELYPELFDLGFTQQAKQKKELAARSSHIITISQESKKNIVDLLGVNPANVTAIYLASGLLDLQPQINLEKPQKYFLHVGERGKYKNWQFMLKAVAPVLNSLSINLINAGGGDFNAEEKQLIKDLNLQNLVTQVSLAPQELANHYAGAVALLSPSYAEGFGITPIEAMQFGCPVVATNVSCMPEVLGQAAILLNPKDVASWQEAANKLAVSDNTNISNLGKQQSAKYSFNQTAKQTWQVYENLSNE